MFLTESELRCAELVEVYRSYCDKDEIEVEIPAYAEMKRIYKCKVIE